jgi:hypothetical protein
MLHCTMLHCTRDRAVEDVIEDVIEDVLLVGVGEGPAGGDAHLRYGTADCFELVLLAPALPVGDDAANQQAEHQQQDRHQHTPLVARTCTRALPFLHRC